MNEISQKKMLQDVDSLLLDLERPSSMTQDIDSLLLESAPAKAASGRVAAPKRKRKNQRYPVAARVVRYDGEPCAWTSLNLSLGGALVKGEPILEAGRQFEIGLWLPSAGGSTEVSVTARIVWSNGLELENFDPNAPERMALQFIDIEADAARELQAFLSTYAKPKASDSPKPASSADIAGLIAGTLAEASRPSRSSRPTPSPRRTPSPQPGRAGAADEPLRPGTILSSYRILDRLGSGGMGEVYVVQHLQLGRKFALKRLHAQFRRSPDVVKRFFDEARVVSQLQHANIVEVTDFISDGADPCYVMELLNGLNLSQHQAQHGPLPAPALLRVCMQLCDALQAVHRAGIIHRDLKPENVVLIERNGQADFVKLLDFGIAKLLEQAHSELSLSDTHGSGRTAPGLTMGTPGYVAPEQLLGQPVDHRCDIYALGVLMYLMATGRNPFVADTWPQLIIKQTTETPLRPSKTAHSRLPRKLDVLIMQCLDVDPNKRPGSMAEIYVRLRQIQSTLAHGMSPARKLALAACGVVVMGVAASVALLEQRDGSAASAAGATRAGNGKSEPERAQSTPPTEPARAAAPARERSSTAETAYTATAARPAAGESARAPTREVDDAPLARRVERPRRAASGGAAARDDEMPARGPPEPVQASEPPPPAKSPPTQVAAAVVKLPAAAPAPARPEPAAVAPAEAAGPSPAAQHYDAGRALLKENKALLAIAEFQECVRLSPRDSKAYRQMGKAYVMLGREADAVAAFEKFVSLAPNDPDAAKLQAIIEQFKSR